MKDSRYILSLKRRKPSKLLGNKAASLQYLRKHKYNIPETWIIPTTVWNEFRNNRTPVLKKLESELGQFEKGNYAIRSSTSVEDQEDYSYAGQFQTYTDVSGKENLLRAIEKVWDSSSDGGKGLYKSHESIDELKCAVIIQEMVVPKLAGVCFSKNPVTDHNEIVIEAIEGPGEDLVQKGVTPFRWRLSQGKILEGPEEKNYEQLILKIALDANRIRKKYRKHVDLEWAYDGDEIYYLQLRAITSNTDIAVYSNKIAQEVLPGQIYPLVWSVNIPMVNGTWIRILSEITGPLDVRPDDLAKAFYFRTYFNIAALGKIFKKFGLSFDVLPFLLTNDDKIKPSFRPGIKALRHTFRGIRFVVRKLNFEKTFLREYDELTLRYKHISKRVSENLNAEKYSSVYKDLFTAGRDLSYLNILVPLLMQFYNRRLQKKLKKAGIDYERIDFNQDFPELKKYSPHHTMQQISMQIRNLPEEIKSRFSTYKEFSKIEEVSDIKASIDKFIADFGHFSESGNDFSAKKWEEDPELVFKMILDTEESSNKSELIQFDKVASEQGLSRKLQKLYIKAGKYRVYREQISSFFTYGCGLFRPFYFHIGEELVKRSILEDKMDVFFLSRQEINDLLNRNIDDSTTYRNLISSRRKEMEDTRDYVLPSVIYGDVAPILEIGNVKNFEGIGTSAGIFRGKARVIRTMKEYKNEYDGGVLIIPFSDVGWTPILTRAKAIVSETGGMLSHCSIIARELGIPALVSVENACAIKDGSTVTVDGSNGILTIHDHE